MLLSPSTGRMSCILFFVRCMYLTIIYQQFMVESILRWWRWNVGRTLNQPAFATKTVTRMFHVKRIVCIAVSDPKEAIQTLWRRRWLRNRTRYRHLTRVPAFDTILQGSPARFIINNRIMIDKRTLSHWWIRWLFSILTLFANLNCKFDCPPNNASSKK